jgi:hypothetical protein
MATRRPGTGAIPLDELRAPTTTPPATPATPVASRRPGTGAVALDDVRAAAAAASPPPGADADAWDVSAPTEAIPLPDADDADAAARKAFDEAAPTEILTLPPSREGKT